jgi:hypothetical protein
MAQGAEHFPVTERVRRFREFYARQNDRPLLGFFVGSEYPLHRYSASQNLPDDTPLHPDALSVEPYLDDSDRLFEIHEACGGDFIWSASAFWGIPWLEAAVGCSVYADHETGSIYTQPPHSFSGPDDIPVFDAESGWEGKVVEFITELASRSGGRWPIGTTRMRGITDLLSAVYGPQAFVLAMIDRPAEVRAVCRRLTDFWLAFARIQLEYIPAFHGGMGSFYYNMWVPAGTVWHQEDAAALLSPQLYEGLIREHDERIVRSLPNCVLHMHPTSYLPIDSYLKIPFLAFELHIDEGGPRARQLYDVHRRILESRPLLIWGKLSDDDLEWIFSKLPSSGLAVMQVVEDDVQAGHVWRKYMHSSPM